MKEIETKNFSKKADMMEYPPVPGETDGSKMPGKKKKKYLPQLNKWVDDVDVDIDV